MSAVDQAVVAARREIERTLLTDTCRIRPKATLGGAVSGDTVACQVQTFDQLSATAAGAASLERGFDRWVTLATTETVAVGDGVDWIDGDETIRVGEVDAPGSHALTVTVRGARIAT